MHLAADNTHQGKEALDDAQLMRRIAQGDRAAFEKLYLGYHRRLSRFLMDKADSFRGSSKVSTWIIGIAYRRALKAFKHSKVQRNAEAKAVEVEQIERLEIFGADSDSTRTQWLAQGMKRLSLEQRMVIELAYFLGHSCEEISQITDTPVNTVKTRMFHARHRLRAVLPGLGEPAGTQNLDSSS